jgi:nuclear-control-of-ATPase protein 2
MQVLKLLEDTLHALPEFELWFLTQLAPYRKPSHVRRHWLAYGVAAAGTVYVANKMYTNRTAITEWGRATARDTSAFLSTHVTEPVASLYRSVFDTFRDRQNLQTSKQSLEQSRRSLESMLQDFAAEPNTAKIAALREGKTVAQYNKEIPERAAAGDMSLVMPRYEEDVRHPIRSLANGELVKGLLIQVKRSDRCPPSIHQRLPLVPWPLTQSQSHNESQR